MVQKQDILTLPFCIHYPNTLVSSTLCLPSEFFILFAFLIALFHSHVTLIWIIGVFSLNSLSYSVSSHAMPPVPAILLKIDIDASSLCYLWLPSPSRYSPLLCRLDCQALSSSYHTIAICTILPTVLHLLFKTIHSKWLCVVTMPGCSFHYVFHTHCVLIITCFAPFKECFFIILRGK